MAARRTGGRSTRGTRAGLSWSRAATGPSGVPVQGLRWRAALLVVLGTLVYAGSLSAPFLFDDETSIVNNTTIRSLTPLSLPLSPPPDTPVSRRPLVNLTFALNYAAHGADPTGFRIVNLAIHLLATLVVFGVVRRTLLLPALAGRFGTASVPIALAAALVWMLHPLQTESVNYLSERTESLMGLFYLLTLYCSIRGWIVAAVAACALGMACKESMVTAPLAVVLYDRVFRFDGFASARRARAGLYAALAATWLVLAGLMSTGVRTSAGFSAGIDVWTYLLNQAELVARYLWLTVWPSALVLDYGLPRPLTLGDVWLPGLLVVGAVVLSLVLLRWKPMLGFLGTWVFLTLAPTSSLVPIATEVGAERRMYLPLAGLAVLAALGLYRVAGRRWVMPATAALCLLLALGTLRRNQEYDSRLTMAQTIVERRPHGRARFLLGTELLAAGRRDEGIAELRRSASDYPGARFALGTEFLGEGRLDEAVAELQAFLAAMPTHPTAVPARDMLGRAFLVQEKFAAAAEQFALLRAAAPGYRGPENDILRNHGYALAASGRLLDALPVLEQAVAANPGDAAARELLDRVRRGTGGPAPR